MTLDDLTATLDDLGVKLSLRPGGVLEVDAPRGVLTPEIKAAMRAHKPALLALLSSVDDPAKLEPWGPRDPAAPPSGTPTKPTKPPCPGDGPGFVGFVSAQGVGSSTFSPAGHAPPVASDPGPPVGPEYPWRVPLPGWPIPWRRAWGRRANELQDRGLSWWQAERQALAEVSRLKYSGGPPPDAEVATTSWDDLAALRWGPAKGDPTPGICIDRPDRGRMRAAMEATADDPDERAAIQSKDVSGLDKFLCDNEGTGDVPVAADPPP